MKEKSQYTKKKRRIKTKRHTHRTAAGLEDAMAILMDVLLGFDAMHSRTDQALHVLRKIREGPHSYDPEQPAGLRITIKKRRG
jgi:hypothetical protein